MKMATITRGGQVSIPAEIRRRWGASRVIVIDHGASVELRPMPVDPIAAVRGSLAGPGPTTDELRADRRNEEAWAEERKYGR